MSERDWEAEAKEQGWNPDYDGDNKVDAKTFVEKGEKIAGILKSRLDRQDQQIRKLQEDNKAFGDYHKKTLEREKAKNADLLAQLEEQRAKAIADGDGQEFTRLDRDIQRVRRDLDTKPPSDEKPLDPLAQAWLMNNNWYQTNRKLQIFADGLADQLVGEGYTGSAYYSELTKRVREEFPEEFENKRRRGSNGVEGGGEREVADKTARTYDNLPPDAKAACQRFVKSGFMTKDEYVAQYEWE